MHECVVQRQVGPRADHPEAAGLGGRDGHARVDVGHLGPGGHGLQEVVDLLHGDGFEQVAAIHHDMLGVLVIDPDLGVGVAEQRAAGRVDRTFAQGVVGEVVRGANGLEKGLAHVRGEVGSLGEGHAVAAVLFDDGLQLVGNVVQRFVPGGLAPLTRAAFTGADHGGLEPLRVVEQRDAGRTPRAQAAVDAGHLRVALDKSHLAVFDRDFDGTADRTHET